MLVSQVIRALERKRLKELDFFHRAVVQKLWILVEPPLVFLHRVLRAQRKIAGNTVERFSEKVPEHHNQAFLFGAQI